jgi:hypothetical protein
MRCLPSQHLAMALPPPSTGLNPTPPDNLG